MIRTFGVHQVMFLNQVIFLVSCYVLGSLFHNESSIEQESSKDTCNFAILAVFAFILLFKTTQNYPVYS